MFGICRPPFPGEAFGPEQESRHVCEPPYGVGRQPFAHDMPREVVAAYTWSVDACVQGSAALVEPLAALLSCVYRLTRTVQQPPAAIPVSGPSLGGSENWMGPGADGEDQQEQSTSQALKARVLWQLSRWFQAVPCMCCPLFTGSHRSSVTVQSCSQPVLGVCALMPRMCAAFLSPLLTGLL